MLANKLLRKLVIPYHYYRGITKLPFPPINILTEITNVCNFRCSMCPQSVKGFRKQGHMSMDLYKKIVNETSNFAYTQCLSMGGEPLLHPKLAEMIKFSKAKGMKNVNLVTNGSLFTKKLSEDIIKAGLDEIIISFEGENKELYERIRPPARHEKTLESIKLFLKTKKELKSKKPDVTITSLTECSFKGHARNTFPRLNKKLTKHFEGLPVDKFRKMWMVDWPGGFKEQKEFEFSSPIKKRDNYMPCNKLWTDIQVLWDGKVVPCCRDLNADFIVGDANKENIIDIWNNKKYQTLRKMILNKEYKDIKLCANCDELFYIREKGTNKKIKYKMFELLRKLRIIKW